MLNIENLHAGVEGKTIVQGLSLSVKPGEVHAVMGPNGSGKSTFSNVLAGKYGYSVTDGSVDFCGNNLLSLEPEIRARKGLFVAFQYPVVIPGLNNLYFLRQAINSVRESHNQPPIDAGACLQAAKKHIKKLGLDESFLASLRSIK